MLPRRQVLRSGLACLATGLAGPLGRAAAAPEQPRDLRFRVTRAGSEIGTHAVSFSQTDPSLIVRTSVNLQVKVAFITAFHYQHESEEIWQDGRLAAARSRTNDNGRKFEVAGEAVRDGFRTVGPSGPFIAAPELLTSNTVWREEFARQSALINVQEGGELGVATTPLGRDAITLRDRQIAATKFRIITPQCAGHLWYDDRRSWVRAELEIKGERVIYEQV